MPVAKTQNFGFLSFSKKLLVYGTFITLAIIGIGGLIAGIGFLTNAIVMSVGVGILAVGRYLLAALFAIYAVTSNEDAWFRAGLLIAAAFLI